MWAKDPKNTDKVPLERFFSAETKLEKLLTLPEVSETYWWLEQLLVKEWKLKLTNYAIVAKLDMLRMLYHC